MSPSKVLLAGAVSIAVFALAHSFRHIRHALDLVSDWIERRRDGEAEQDELPVVGDFPRLPRRRTVLVGWRESRDCRRSHRRLDQRYGL